MHETVAVAGAGNFVEFEFKGDAENPEEVITRLDDFIDP